MAEKNQRRGLRSIFNRKPKIEEQVVASEQDILIKDVITSTKTLVQSTDVSTENIASLLAMYKRMDNDAVISAALDLYADNATQVDVKTGHVIAVESTDKRFQEEVNEFLWDTVKIDTEAWQIIRDVARDGMIYLDTNYNNNDSDWAFVPVTNPENIKALTDGRNEIKYFAVKPDVVKDDDIYSNIRLINTQQDEYTIEPHTKYIVGFNTKQLLGSMTVKETSNFGDHEEGLLIRSGRSILAPVVQTWETLSALEDSLFVNRLTKSKQFKVVSIDVGDSNNKQAKQIVDAIKNTIKSSETIDNTVNKYQNRQSPVPTDDFIFIPTKGEKGAVTFEEVGGQVGEINISDIDYYRNKLFAGLGVLKAYLGFEETTPGGLGDSTLTKLDERLGRRIIRLKQVLHSIVDQMIKFYWINTSITRDYDNMPDYKIISGKVSTKEDQDNRDRFKDSIEIADSFIRTATNELFSEFVSKEKLFAYVFDNIIGVSTKHFDNKPDAETVTLKVKNISESRQFSTNIKINRKHGSSIKGKLRDVLSEDLLSYFDKLVNEEDLFIETEDGWVIPLNEALKSKNYKDVLLEYTYQQLKDMSKQSDPARLAKAKKSTAKYMGLDDENNIVFVVTAENPSKNKDEGKPTSYITKVKLKELDWVIDINEKEGRQINDRDIVRLAIGGDLEVSCTCPAAKYWGQQYKGTVEDYSMDKNEIKPTKNIPLQTVCKHTLMTLIALPFWNNSIVRDLRAKDIIKQKPKVKKAKSKKVAKQKDEEILKDIEKL